VRLVALLVLVLAAVPATAPAAAPSTELQITLWPRGKGTSPPHRWTLRCGPPGGTLPNRAAACARLTTLRDPFAPVPRDAACTEQFGGPAEATVTGRHKGRRISAQFNRTDGCRIARWQKHAFLFGGVPLPLE
jgi:hypothetical protein